MSGIQVAVVGVLLLGAAGCMDGYSDGADEPVPEQQELHVAGPCSVEIVTPEGVVQRTGYEYDARGLVVREQTCATVGAPRSTSTSRTFDEAGRLVRVELDEGVDGTVDQRIAYRYLLDARGLVLEQQVDFEADGTIDASSSYRYDEAGRRIETRWDNNLDGIPNQINRFQYDDLGRELRDERDGNRGAGLPDGEPDEQVSFLYDEQGRLVERTVDLGANGSIDRRARYEYDAAGRLLAERWDEGPDGTIDSSNLYDWSCWR